MKKLKKEKKKVDYKSFTVNEIKQELKRETHKSKFTKMLKSTIYTLVIIAAISTLIATFVIPVLQISGSSMNTVLKEGDIVLSIKKNNFKQGDVIAFYHGNKILVKRVIAGSGNFVSINDDGLVYVNGKKLEEEYITKFSMGDGDIKYPYQVPDSSWFVLGDERELSVDSRNSDIGSISKENIIGKVIFRVWPLNRIGKIE